MARGPHSCRYMSARHAFERAIELGKSGDIALEEPYCRIASTSLSLLERGRGPSFGPRGPFGSVGFDSDDDDDAMGMDEVSLLNHLLATMPPDLKKELDKLGLSPLDALRALAGRMGGSDG